ncbi:hypothetical protein JCM8547_006289 [Rhodosporidiobolus lusitaniae]
MSRAGSEPLRGPPYSSTPPPSRRRPAPSVLSPLSTQSPNDSFRSSSYQPSLFSHSDLSTLSGAPLSRYLNSSVASIAPSSFSVAPSHAGSLATTANPSGPIRFKRGHVRKGRGGVQTPPAVKTNNPDEVDLMALEEPDEVFRQFGVRDVRKLEKRASDAAAAKVADLRTMVGERYRDLLAAADSIVRMRSAAEKLVDSLDSVEDSILEAGAAINDTPRKPNNVRRGSRRSISPSRERTFASAPTLSLTIHLLLTIPSLVHSQLETSSFLAAARLEDLGRVVYRQLSEFEPDEEDRLLDEEGQPRTIRDLFPIVEKQNEALSALKPLILRRALGELRAWEATPLSTAQTLASIAVLQNASPSSALTTLLQARSDALSTLLSAPSSSRSDTAAVVSSLQQVLGLILRTVETVVAVFGSSPSAQSAAGLLRQLLQEVEHPSASASAEEELPEPHALPPILTTLPNYATLARHLPTSLLTHTPALSSSVDGDGLSSSPNVDSQLSTWLSAETDRVVTGVSGWITSLTSSSSSSSTSGAKPLSHLRTALLTTLSTSTPSSLSAAQTLRTRLSHTIEARLAAVYTAQLSLLVQRVEPALSAILLALPGEGNAVDREPAKFLFEAPLVFPTTTSHSSSSSSAAAGGAGGGHDPFESFLSRVSKRVAGRSPLLDQGLSELELLAKGVRSDLEGWLGASLSDDETAQEEQTDRERLRKEYVRVVRATLEGVVEAVEKVLQAVEEGQGDGRVEAALFVGNFAGGLASSRAFVRDLLLGVPAVEGSEERETLLAWQSRLAAVQDRSLSAWREEAVAKAVRKLEESMNEVAASGPLAGLWAWDAFRSPAANADTSLPLLPTAPSPFLLTSLHSLSHSLNLLPLPRRASPAPARSLVLAFSSAASHVAAAFAETLEGEVKNAEGGEKKRKRAEDVAKQAAWDVRMLGRVVEVATAGEREGGKGAWEELGERFLRIATSTITDLTPLTSHLSTSTLLYLQRTQSLFAPLLPSSSSLFSPPPAAPGSRPVPLSLQRLLPLGPPSSGTTGAAAAGGGVGASTPGLIKPGPRLGLLPTRG